MGLRRREAQRWDAGGRGWGLLVGVAWVAGPVVGVLSWSSGCEATSSLALNRESIA